MLVAATINGPSYGLGASRTLVQGTDFNCNASICYAIGAANHALFQQLQSTLNTYAKLGISAYRNQLNVDGFLGDQTLTAARAAAAAALLPAPSTKPQLAQQAAILNDGLQAFLGNKTTTPSASAPVAVATAPSAPTATPIITSTPSPVPGVMNIPTAVKTPAPSVTVPAAPIVTAAPSAAALTPVTPTTSKMPLWAWITAGAVGVIVVGAVGYAVLREPAPKPALARRRRRRR